MISNLTPQEFEFPITPLRLGDKGRTWWRLILNNMYCIYNKAINYRQDLAMDKIKNKRASKGR